jgi:phospholipid/cholesterol/gamma-HCH transport system ATP-binding protein
VSAPAIGFRRVGRSFAGRAVLRDVDLAIRSGETYTILGGSGSGKSVCLKHMIGLLRPDAGRVSVFGRDVTDLPERDWVEVRKDFGMVFQGAALFDSLPVLENVAYPLREHRDWPEEQVRERVRVCLEAVGLVAVEAVMPAALSGGMRKRVGIARAIALEPRIVLYDEPTTGLDPANARRIAELIRHLQRRLQVTSVVVTHDMELCFTVSDRVGLLHRGQIVVEDEASEMQGLRHPEMRAFLEGTPDPASRLLQAPQPEEGMHGG